MAAQEESLTFKHNFTKENPGHLEQFYDMDKGMLGEGSYGRVAKGTDRATGQIRAIKAIALEKIVDTKRFHNEVHIQMHLDHPNIVKLYEVFKDARFYYLVMELCTGGELFDRIVEEADKHEGQAFGEAQAAKIMQQILGAVHYMHGNNFAHRDIKPENFLMQNKDRDAAIKVIDFGLAKEFKPGESNLKTKAGTPYYVAPQVLLSSSSGYNEKCDIWSCGVLCYIILCGYPPFYGERDPDILKMVKAGRFEFPSPDWDDVSADAKSIISDMLTFRPENRPSAGRLLEHPWFRVCEGGPALKLSKDLGGKLRKFTGASRLKKVALTLIAQNLKEEEIAELKETFGALDRNKDGTLSQAEIEEGMQKHNLTLPADFRDTLRALDTDGSGAIDYSEFIAATLSKKTYMKKEVLWAAFRRFDTDGSGHIDREELKKVLQDDCVQRVDVVLKEVDLNGDGKISFEEFCEMMK